VARAIRVEPVRGKARWICRNGAGPIYRNAYAQAYRAAADLRQAARGKAWSDIDPTVPAHRYGPRRDGQS
jgi:hypothetical protein